MDAADQRVRCRLLRHWPRGIVAFGWLWLAYITADDTSIVDPSFLDSWIWSAGAMAIGAVTLLHWAAGGQHLRWLVSYLTITYAVARGWSYAVVDIWAPAAIWLIVVGLTINGYRAALRGGKEL